MIYVLLILLFLLASLLVFPIGVELDYSERGQRWYVVWMWLHIPVPGIARRVARSEGKKWEGLLRMERTSGERTGTRLFGNNIGEFVDGMRGGVQMFEEGLRALRSFSHHLHIRVHHFHVVLATPNPALTGFGYGMWCAVDGAFAPPWPVYVETDFISTRPKVDFRVEARLSLIRIVPAFWRLGRTARAQMRARDKNNQERKP